MGQAPRGVTLRTRCTPGPDTRPGRGTLVPQEHTAATFHDLVDAGVGRHVALNFPSLSQVLRHLQWQRVGAEWGQGFLSRGSVRAPLSSYPRLGLPERASVVLPGPAMTDQTGYTSPHT